MDFRGCAFSLTKETANDPEDNGFGIRSKACRIISQCYPSRHSEHVEILHYVFSLKPDLCLFGSRGECISNDPMKTRICLSYGYRFPNLVHDCLKGSHRYYIPRSEYYSVFRLLFEHGTLCPPKEYNVDFTWIFDLYNDVVTRRENCARACVALGAIRKYDPRGRSQRDVLSIVIKLVWETRRKDAWLKK